MTPLLLPAAAPETIAFVDSAGGDWHAKSLGGALGLTALFGLIGVVLAFVGYKIFDGEKPEVPVILITPTIVNRDHIGEYKGWTAN